MNLLTKRAAFDIEKPTKKQQTLLAAPIYVKDTLGEPWSIPPGNFTHTVLVHWLTTGGHNDAYLPVGLVRHPDQVDPYWDDDPYKMVSMITPDVITVGPVANWISNMPFWVELSNFAQATYTEKFNEWKRSLAPTKRKRAKKERAGGGATSSTGSSPFS